MITTIHASHIGPFTPFRGMQLHWCRFPPSSSPSPGPAKALCRARPGLKPGPGSAPPAGWAALNITIPM
ncbi:hypothetical protein DFH09DRAFT_1323245 [Mycena vulgaris]|nr:hypothetical protein DFH09DRAFT_1323245 [Mycena vulgaris]